MTDSVASDATRDAADRIWIFQAGPGADLVQILELND
jgi:hypothetical protein